MPLSVERIVEAAFTIMERDGFEAVSMRRVAQQLGTGPASLYAHISGKRELDSLIIDRMAAEITVPDPDPGNWKAQVAQVMRDIRDTMRRHPGLARAVIANIPTGGDAMVTADRMLAILLAAGIHEQVAAWACDLLPLYVTAVAYEESVYVSSGGIDGLTEEEFAAQLRTYYASLPIDHFPHLVASATALTAGTGDDRFEFGMRVLLAGLAVLSDEFKSR